MPFKKRPNTHQTHFEDLVLLGPDGLEELDDKIEKVIDTLENNSEKLILTTKLDGAPAITVWSKYPGYPDNSVALKGFISGPQNAISSIDQINNKYPDESRANMREMLEYGLKLAPYIPAGEAWQGDCLFVKGSKREEEISGKDYITFQPNKIIYAFSEDNPGYEQVKNADFGIAFHTIYKGEDKQQSFKVDASRLNAPNNIYIMSPALTRPRDNKIFNTNDIKSQYSRLQSLEQKLLSNFDYEDLCNNAVFMKYWYTFENANLADKKAVTINETTFINDLKEYIKDKRTKEYDTQVSKLKTDAGKEKAKTKYEQDLIDLQDLVDTNKGLLTTLVQTLNCAATIKMLLWQGFKQTQFNYSTFYKSRTKGFLPGEMEGVAMSDQDGNIVKIVDRSTFSSYNRDPDIMSGFEHPENKNEELESFREYFNEELVENKPSWDKFSRLLENNGKTAVIAFGRMNPPTIGHQKLVDIMASLAQGEKAKLFLSHTQDKKKNPLSYEDKIYFAKKAFGSKVDIVESNAKTVINVFTEVYSQGYTNVVYVSGEDRLGSDGDNGDITYYIMKYNGQPDQKGNILYDFDTIEFKSAGGGDETGSRDNYTYDYVKQNLDNLNLQEIASASLVRECAKQGDFELFSKLVPFDESTTRELFNKVRQGLNIINEGLLTEVDHKSVFASKRDLSRADSFKGAYDLLLAGIEEPDVRGQVETIIKQIETITNSINIDQLKRLSERLITSNSDLNYSQFISTLNPTEEDIELIINHNKLEVSKENNINIPNFSNDFYNRIKNHLPKADAGTFEYLLAVLFPNMAVSKSGKGDLILNGNDPVEVKSIKSGATLRSDNTDGLVNIFDDFIFNRVNKGQLTKGDSGLRPNLMLRNLPNEDISKDEVPRELGEFFTGSTIKLQDLFKKVFTAVIEDYSKEFKYMILCKDLKQPKIVIHSTDGLAEFLLDNTAVKLSDYQRGYRVFKIS